VATGEFDVVVESRSSFGEVVSTRRRLPRARRATGVAGRARLWRSVRGGAEKVKTPSAPSAPDTGTLQRITPSS
jgi:hypothetical protein